MDILKGSGADGIAVVSAIMKADDPKKSSEELRLCSEGGFDHRFFFLYRNQDAAAEKQARYNTRIQIPVKENAS